MKYFLLIFALFLIIPISTSAATPASTVGKILLDVEANGEAWYIYPEDESRYYLGRPDDAYDLMRELGLGISNANLELAMAGSSSVIDGVKGKILLQVEEHGEAYYVNPDDGALHYMANGSEAFEIMRSLGLGASSATLSTIPVSASSLNAASTAGATYILTTVATDVGSFSAHVVKISKDDYDMITDTAQAQNCEDNCEAKYLEEFVEENNATIGIHGTYFCPPDYSSCANAVNHFDPPVFSSDAGVLVNEDDLAYHNGPMMIYTEENGYWFYHRANSFGDSLEDFEDSTNQTLLAGIAHYPSLVENGEIVVESEIVNASQQLKSTRGGIGFNGEYVYLVVATGASVTDMAWIMEELGADWAMNLDGGASASLYYEGAYKYGPSRQLPNAILFKTK